MWFTYAILVAFCWAVINVLDSILVHNYEKKPMALMWSQSMFSLPILLVLSQIVPLETSWLWILLLFGIIGYVGDLWFFHVLEHVDVSVSNLAWALLSLFLALAGFLIFQDTWSTYQTIGGLLVISGTLCLSFFHQHLNLKHALFLILSLSLVYVPFYVVKMMAIKAGELPVTVFFWMVLAREVSSFSLPFAFRTVRTTAFKAIRSSWHFSLINLIVILSFFLAEYMGALSYALGPLSLVAITNNVQPFFVLGLAGLCAWLIPTRMPKELLTAQSVWVKLASFLIVFTGLAFLTIS